MYLTAKIALKPNKEQEELFWSWANAARFVYNFSLNLKSEAYRNDRVSLSWNDITKIITSIKYDEKYRWLSEVPSETIKYAVKDMDCAFKHFFQGGGYPKFKKKSKTVPAFYTRYDKLNSIDDKHIKICGIKTPVKTYEKCLIPNKPTNPRIKFDGRYWYLTYGVEISPENISVQVIKNKLKTYTELQAKNSSSSLGIDLGIEHTAVCSNGKTYENINKTPEIIRLETKKKILQKQLSRKYELNKQGNKYIKTKNIIKLEKQIKIVQRRLNNIRNNYINQITSEIVKTKPSKIVLENLVISNMMKNRYLAKRIQEQNWYKIRHCIEYKATLYIIPVQLASRTYPSSKTCSQCGYINKNLTLSDRTYICPNCGFKINRDFNASINLSRL